MPKRYKKTAPEPLPAFHPQANVEYITIVDGNGTDGFHARKVLRSEWGDVRGRMVVCTFCNQPIRSIYVEDRDRWKLREMDRCGCHDPVSVT